MRSVFTVPALFVTSVATVGLLSSVSRAANYVNTFDSSASPFRVDYYNGTTGTPTVTFDSTHDSGGSPTSGSAKFTATLDGTAQGVAFTADALYPATPVSNISFDLMVDPTSAAGASSHGAGYFQVFTRQTDNYNQTDTGYNENLGNPSYDSVSHYGVWEHINIPLDPTGDGNAVRAITVQDYNNNAITGTVSYYIDNLVLTTPEPGSLSFLGLAAAALARRSRSPQSIEN